MGRQRRSSDYSRVNAGQGNRSGTGGRNSLAARCRGRRHPLSTASISSRRTPKWDKAEEMASKSKSRSSIRFTPAVTPPPRLRSPPGYPSPRRCQVVVKGARRLGRRVDRQPRPGMRLRRPLAGPAAHGHSHE